MKYTIAGVKRTTLPKKAGGTWVKTEVKLKETGDQIYELNFSKYIKDGLVQGTILNGYLSEKSWTGRNGVSITKVFNAIDAEYLYDMILKMNPAIEGSMSVAKAPVETASVKTDVWEETGPAAEETATVEW
jgi:hypothetical protein